MDASSVHSAADVTLRYDASSLEALVEPDAKEEVSPASQVTCRMDASSVHSAADVTLRYDASSLEALVEPDAKEEASPAPQV
jgi:hypothetical protein